MLASLVLAGAALSFASESNAATRYDWRFRFRTRLMGEALAESLSPAARSMLEQRIARDGAPGPEATRLESRASLPTTRRASLPRAGRPRAVKRNLAS